VRSTLRSVLTVFVVCSLFVIRVPIVGAADQVTKAPATPAQVFKTILVMVPWADLVHAAIQAASTSQSADSKTVTLDYIKDDAKLLVAEAQVSTQVTKWQEESYGSITIKTDVVSRVTYAVDLKKVTLHWDNEKKAVVVAIPKIQVDSIEYKTWEPTVSYTRVRKWFASDTRAALEAQTRETVKSEVRKEAEKYLTDVRVKYLTDLQVTAENRMKELSPTTKIVFE
jgi:hypothetical protein